MVRWHPLCNWRQRLRELPVRETAAQGRCRTVPPRRRLKCDYEMFRMCSPSIARAPIVPANNHGVLVNTNPISKRGLQLLTPSLLEDSRVVDATSTIAADLRISYGWHYHLDFAWIVQTLSQLGVRPGATVADVGAGNGVLQFLLASLGYHVVSIDYSDRALSRRMRLGYRIRDTKSDVRFEHSYLEHIGRGSPATAKNLENGSRFNGLARLLIGRLRSRGSVVRVRADMRRIDALQPQSVDAVVSVSAIEHLEMDAVASAIAEFRRILRPGGPIVVTTSASSGDTWFHEPSRGLCFSEEDLSGLFAVPKGWGDYGAALNALDASTHLKSLLHRSYFVSGDNGMPWGEWAPSYVPVGVVA